MTDRELERKLAQAITRAAPDDLEAILSRCGAQNGSVMEMKELKSNGNIIDVEVTEVRPKKKLRPWLAAACAALVLLGAGGGGLVYHQSYAVASVVSLDVNPSIELKVNRGERTASPPPSSSRWRTATRPEPSGSRRSWWPRWTVC